MSRPLSRTGQNHPPRNRIADNLRSRKTTQVSIPPHPKAQVSTTVSPQAKSSQNSKDDDNPDPQDDAEQPSCTEATALFKISEALEETLAKFQMPDNLKEELSKIKRFASKAGVREGKKDIFQITIEDVRDLRKDLLADLSASYNTLNDKLSSIANGQVQILKATEHVTKEAMGIKATTKEIDNKVTKVTDATDQIASTTRTYKDAVLTQPTTSVTDLKLRDDLERKAKQIMMDVHSDDLKDKSLTEIKSKANKVIAEIDDEDRPDNVVIEMVTIRRSKAYLLQLNTKKAANWLREPRIETKFTEGVAKDSFFIGRNFNIIVPRTPITFEPKNDADLREIEDGNNLTPNSIRKARWIKPINRRREGQTHAYAIITLTSPATANHLIRKGILICGIKTTPTKLKHEPIQCLCCRGWGHLIAQCLNTHDICGACGEEHNTSECDNPHKHFCISCKDNTHASWDRGCPEFIRHCEIHNSKFPENNLQFFPTDEEWTLTTRPDKIPLESRFPERYAVNSLPTAAMTKCLQQQNQQRSKPKRQNNQPAPQKCNTQSSENNTIERYMTRSQPNAAASSSAREVGELPEPSYRDTPARYDDLFHPRGDDYTTLRDIPGWG